MTKTPQNHGRPWTSSDNTKLRSLARENTPTRVIGIKTGRTPGAVYQIASENGISLRPTNQSPYNRK